MAAKRKKRKPARRKRRNQKNGSFGSMLFGLVAGLAIAGGIWWATLPESQRPKTASVPAAAKASTEKPEAGRDEAAAIEATGSGYDFYDMLPEQEVVVSDDFAARRQPRDQAAPAETVPVTDPGAYIIQAGSFRSAQDADSMKATLAILGMQARVEIVEIRDRVFHRVRIGPLKDVDIVNDFRRRLREEKIDVVLIRVDS